MRVLVVGAGAIGGYFGGRLLQAQRDVTFLVRPRRAAELAKEGLIIKSPRGNVTLRTPATILAENLREPFDLVLLSCKAYDLTAAMDSFAAAVGRDTLVLPLLNGMKHLEILDQRFGKSHILGGLCIIAATLDAQHAVVHLNDMHRLAFGERDGANSQPMRAVVEFLGKAGFDAHLSGDIVQEMWEKWVLLATLAGVTCLMRAAIGDIMASPGGGDLILELLEECRGIAAAAGHAPSVAFLDQARAALTARGSPLTASMLRDVESNAPVEADHIVGDLLRRRQSARADHKDLSLLATVYTHLKAYENRRDRTRASALNAGG
ncbi:MAG: 2-dehydropantoate 2-reductase [Steroidobacteraceae bacterium]|jgi:2-dehydropantoate 2-reductase